MHFFFHKVNTGLQFAITNENESTQKVNARDMDDIGLLRPICTAGFLSK